MLIYNFNKEFLGIDEHDLEALGFSNLAQLRAESEDFANLFVKTPGYVHNFKHVHWIDFVSCIEGGEDSKVIIHAKGKSYKCILNIKTAYLIDHPSEKAFLVTLQNLRALTNEESSKISGDLVQRVAPKAATEPAQLFNAPEETLDEEVQSKPQDDFIHLEDSEESAITHDPYEIESTNDEKSNIIEDIYEDAPIEIELEEDDTEVESTDNFSEEIELPQDIEEEIETQIESNDEEDAQESVVSEYNYDPQVASSELGLPIDLIEEFVEDFIAQAKEFKDELYSSLNNANLSQVKTLSHKLKGVAANLRIEDAREALIVVNTSNNVNEISSHLDLLYTIVAKLSGEEIKEVVTAPVIEEEIELIDEAVEIEEEAPEIEDAIEIEEEIAQEVETPDEAIEIDNEAIEIEEEIAQEVETPDEAIEIEEEIAQEVETPDEAIEIEEEIAQEVETPDEAIEIEEEIAQEVETPDEAIEIEEEITQEVETPDKAIEIEEEIAQEVETPDEAIEIEETVEEVTYNKSFVANEIGLDEESFNTLFNDYMNESRSSCDAIKNAIDENSAQDWQLNAIKLKGMSDNMRVDNISDELTEIINTDDANTARSAFEKVYLTITKLGS